MRRMIGITGAPGVGKTTYAVALVARHEQGRTDGRVEGGPGEEPLADGPAVHLPMDGFHLADVSLELLGLRDRKGAPETFDGWGYAALLARLRSEPDHVVYAPAFERDLEQPLAGAIAVPPDTGLVVTEGNYLLLDEPSWRSAREQLDEVWFLDEDPELRRSRLVARHVEFGKTPEEAAAWVAAVDDANADLVGRTRERADRVVDLRDAPPLV